MNGNDKWTEEFLKSIQGMDLTMPVTDDDPLGSVLSPEEFNPHCGIYKYVRFADSVVKFCDATVSCFGHAGLVVDYNTDGKNVPPVSAGTIKTRGKTGAFRKVEALL